MTAPDLLAELRRRGVDLEERQGRLRYRAPGGALTDDLRAGLAAHRDALLKLLRQEATEPGPGPADELQAHEPPIRRLERDWAAAIERARVGFARHDTSLAWDDLKGAARLELELVERRQLLERVYSGELTLILDQWTRRPIPFTRRLH